MPRNIRIGTRDSQLAIWQATQVQLLLEKSGYTSMLVFIKSEGDIDLQTPIYEMGVEGVFTKSLDIALLNNQIDIAVHSMKDVPIQLAKGITQTAVLERGSYKDLLVFKGNQQNFEEQQLQNLIIATSSIRRKAQWLHRYPHHTIAVLRGNINTRLQKLQSSNWNGAIFAAAGLERIQLRPTNAIELDWMLPAPAQGAIMVVARNGDDELIKVCENFNDEATSICTTIERDFLRILLGGCSTPISALAQIENNKLIFKGNITAPDGSMQVEVNMEGAINKVKDNLSRLAAQEILSKGADKIITDIQHAKFN